MQNAKYQWNHRNQLVNAKVFTAAGKIREADYGYNALGQRISKTFVTVAGVTTPSDEYYAYDTGGMALQLEKHGTSDLRVTRRFFNGPGGDLYAVEQVGYPDSVKTSQDVVWPLADYQGTVRDLYWQTNAATNAPQIEHREFDPYGAPVQLDPASAGRIVEAMTAACCATGRRACSSTASATWCAKPANVFRGI